MVSMPGLTATQEAILRVLSDVPQQPWEIARRVPCLNGCPGAAARSLRILVDRGLVEQQTLPKQGRWVLFTYRLRSAVGRPVSPTLWVQPIDRVALEAAVAAWRGTVVPAPSHVVACEQVMDLLDHVCVSRRTHTGPPSERALRDCWQRVSHAAVWWPPRRG